MYRKGDFHNHSTFSDGGLRPYELVDFAIARGIDIMSITDHNVIDGIQEGIIYGESKGVRVVPGVELSVQHKGKRVHILGYFRGEDYINPILKVILKYIKGKKANKIKKVLGDKVNIKSRGSKLTVEEGIELLKYFNASVVLAHPVLLDKNVFKEIIDFDFDGIEAKYFLNKKEDTENFINISKDRNLYYTAGSDFHNLCEMFRIHGILGDAYLNEEEIRNFIIKSGI